MYPMTDNDNIQREEEKKEGMVLRTEGLVKQYGKRTVVSNVSINVRQGEIVDCSVRTGPERPHRSI